MKYVEFNLEALTDQEVALLVVRACEERLRREPDFHDTVLIEVICLLLGINRPLTAAP